MSHDPARALELTDPSTPCQLCAHSGERSTAAEPWAFGEHLLWLCAGHRARAEAAPSLDALRALFREAEGQRSLLPRRLEDRRVFPPRPEGRRRGGGRRHRDPGD